MPVLSKFYGIVVRLMDLRPQGLAIYANYGEHEIILDASTLQILSGSVPGRVLDLVLEWANQHPFELQSALQAVRTGCSPTAIAPLA